MKQLNKESKKHANYLRSRHSPIERNEMFNKQRKIKNEVMHELQLSKATLNEVGKFIYSFFGAAYLYIGMQIINN